MTESHQQTRQGQPHGDDPAHEQARTESERVVREDGDVRRAVRDAILKAARERSVGVGSLRRAAQGAVDGVVAGVKDVSESRRDTTLGEAMSGIGDAMQQGVNATRYALEEAESRGERFAEQDVKSVRVELESLGQTLEETVKRAGRELDEQSRDLMRHYRRTFDAMRPSVEEALAAVRKHPAQAVGDAAAMGVEATGKLAQAALDIAGGVVDGLRGAVAGGKRDKSESPSQADSGSAGDKNTA